MKNIAEENKCSLCDIAYEFIIDSIKVCLEHAPKEYAINIKRLCKYCDMEEKSKHVCSECRQKMSKKEWAVARWLRKNIGVSFIYNSSKLPEINAILQFKIRVLHQSIGMFTRKAELFSHYNQHMLQFLAGERLINAAHFQKQGANGYVYFLVLVPFPGRLLRAITNTEKLFKYVDHWLS